MNRHKIPLFFLYGSLLLTSLTFNANAVAKSSKSGQKLETIKSLMKEGDYLGARIIIKDAFLTDFDFELWKAVRKIGYSDPRLGYDLILALEQHPNTSQFQDSKESKINELSLKGDSFFKQKQYQSAIDHYLRASSQIKQLYKGRVPKENQQFYFYNLHQIARSYFSLKSYDPALKIYNFLPPSYFDIRQVQFEKMWTAYYLGRLDQAIGAIASIRSPYFSELLEPEVFLVQLYIQRKLCRYSENTSTLNEIKRLSTRVSENKISLADWSKMDISTIGLFELAKNKDNLKINLDVVSLSKRKKEVTSIFRYLKTHFANDLNRLKEGYSKILNFSILSKKITNKALPRIYQLPNPKVLYASGYEYWPRQDVEEWMDEFGTYIYIGESNCSKL